jgi:hypothetical protein
MAENRFQTEDSLDFVSLEIFRKIFSMVFGTSDMEDIRDLNPEKFNEEKIILLFFWPLIITKRYLYPYMELDLFKEQCKINQFLSTDFDLDEIWNTLSIFDIDKNLHIHPEELEDNMSEDQETSYELDLFSELYIKGFEKLENEINFKNVIKKIKEDPKDEWIDWSLGGKPNSKTNPIFLSPKIQKRIFFTLLIERIIDETAGAKLRKGILYYYLILFLFLDNCHTIYSKNSKDGVEKDYNNTLIDFDEILRWIFELSNFYNDKADVMLSNCFEILQTFGSLLFGDVINFFINDYKEIFQKSDSSENSYYEEHQFYKNNPKYIAWISKLPDEAEENLGDYSIGVQREIKLFEEYDYKLEFSFEKDLLDNTFENCIIFKCDKNKSQLKQLLHCLSILAYRLSIHINNYSNEYNYFISNADICVDQDLERFIEVIDSIQNSYFLFNEYLEHKDFSRAIETLDTELAYKCIEEIRDNLKKTKKTHLSPELIQDLLVANKEIKLLFSIVQREHDAHKTKIAKEYFKENSNFFKILNFDDIKNVDFSSDPNIIRNTRRKIFYNIAEKAGKEIKGYKIAKELAVE